MAGREGYPPAFRLYWQAEAVSGFGSYITLLALQTLVVLTLRGSTAQVGWLNAARWLPYLVTGVVVGAWGIRPMLLIAAAIFALVAAGLAATPFRTVRAPI
jgi:MFS family permease